MAYHVELVSLDTHTERIQAIEQLQSHEGWNLFVDAMAQEWGSDAVLDRLTAALTQAKTSSVDEQREFTKLLNARELVRQVVGWPARELARLKGQGSSTVHTPRPLIRRA